MGSLLSAPKKSTAMQAWDYMHVFISSTFNDMHAERDSLYFLGQRCGWVPAREDIRVELPA